MTNVSVAHIKNHLDLLCATRIASTLATVPEREIPHQVESLQKALFQPAEAGLKERTFVRQLAPSLESYDKIWNIFHLARKNLSKRADAALNVLKRYIPTAQVVLDNGKVLVDIPFSRDSLLESFLEEYDESKLTLPKGVYTPEVVESVMSAYRNFYFGDEREISGDPSLAKILISGLALKDLIDDQISIAQRHGKKSAEGREIAFNIHLQIMDLIDSLGDNEMRRMPCMAKLLFDFASLGNDDLIDLYLSLKDFPYGLKHQVGIFVLAELTKRKKASSDFDAKLRAKDESLPVADKFYDKCFAPQALDSSTSIDRYAAHLLSASEADYEDLLKLEQKEKLPSIVLEHFFIRCITSNSCALKHLESIKAFKKIKEEVYYSLLKMNPSSYVVGRLLAMACLHGKLAIVQKILFENTDIPAETLRIAFYEACRSGHMPILELFRGRFDTFLQGAIGRSLELAASNRQLNVVQFLMRTEFFTSCPINAKNSVASSIMAAAMNGDAVSLAILDKLMETEQFAQLPIFIENQEHLPLAERQFCIQDFLRAFAERKNLAYVLKFMRMERMKAAIHEHHREEFVPFLGTPRGALLYGANNPHWAPMLRDIIASNDFAEIPTNEELGVGRILEEASQGGASLVVDALIANNKYGEIQMEGNPSIVRALCFAAKEGHLAVVQSFLRSARSGEIPLHQNGLAPGLMLALNIAIQRGHLPVVLELQANIRIQETLTEGERALLSEAHGGIKRALMLATTKNSLPLMREVIRSDQFDFIPAVAETSLWQALSIAAQLGELEIVNAILNCRRIREISLADLEMILNLALRQGEVEIAAAIATCGQFIQNAPENLRPLLSSEHGGIKYLVLSAVQSSTTELLQMLLASPLFQNIPLLGPNSIIEYLALAIKRGRKENFRLLLDLPRCAEIPLNGPSYSLKWLFTIATAEQQTEIANTIREQIRSRIQQAVSQNRSAAH